MQRSLSMASTCLLLGSLCVGGMGVIWFVFLVIGALAGVAGAAGAGFAAAFAEVEIPTELFYTGGALWIGAILLMSMVALANLFGGTIGLFSALRGFTGRPWGIRTAAMVHVVMALVFGLPGAITMNPLALVWVVVLVLAVATLVLLPRPALDDTVT